MSFHVKVYAIADKYDVKQLQTFAATRLGQVLDPQNDLQDFINAVQAVDESSQLGDRTLWDVVIPTIKDSITYLLGQSEFREMLDDIPQLQFDLLALLDPKAAPYKLNKLPEVKHRSDFDNDDVENEDEPSPTGRWGCRAGRGRRLG